MTNTEYRQIIRANQGVSHYWKDLWRYRELFYFLAWRDLTVRYKQTVLGVSWSVLRPLITMVVFTIIFGGLAKFPSGGVPYPILVFAAMLPWQFFANALTLSSSSLISNAQMITKIYFPRLAIPTSALIVSLVDFLISFAILICLMLWYSFNPGWRIMVLPFLIFIVCALAMGTGLWTSSLNVKYRDFRIIVPFIVQLGIYISPIGFSSEVVPAKYRLIYSLNPMVGVIDGFRWAILGKGALYWPGFILSLLLVGFILYSGFKYFRRMERVFADII